MSNYNPDDATQPMPPRPQQNGPQPGPGQPYVGGHQPGQRRPYQYQPVQPPQSPPSQPPRSPQYPGQPPATPAGNWQQGRPPVQPQPGQYGQPPMQPRPGQPQPSPAQRQQGGAFPPLPQTPPYEQSGPNRQPGQMAGAKLEPRRKKKWRQRRGCQVGCLTTLLIFVVIGIFAFTTIQRVLAFGSKISFQAPLSTQTGYMGTSDRTNLLIMGYGGGQHDGAYLTDSLLVVSLLPQSHHTSLVSVPRDLWVQYPANSGQYTKINSIYEFASNNNADPKAGGTAVTQKISLITGMDVKYWLTIDFAGFKKVIDSIGGVDVTVPNSFNACYPKNDDAAIDPSWIKVQFNKGTQHMDGNTAITYARAREPLEVCGQGTSENYAELTDFGRSARQQLIVKAVMAKVKEFSTWPHLYDAMDALQQTIKTNMSLADLAEFALKMDLNDPKAARIGLSNQNVLQDSTSDNGQYILTAANGNWGAIPDYIKQHLYN